MPTTTDVDAALAEVRARAIPIARRQARNHRASITLTGLLVVGGAFLTGATYAGNGIHLGVTEFNYRGDFAGAPELERLQGAATPRPAPVPGPTVRGFHVSSTTSWYGEEFGRSESYVTGPPGTAFIVTYSFLDEFVTTSIRAQVVGDSVQYLAMSNIRGLVGASARQLPLYEEGQASTSLWVRRGDVVLLRPLGRNGMDDPKTVIRIEGPDAPPPQVPVHWRVEPPQAALLGGMDGWRTRAAAPHGVRVANVGFGHVWVAGAWINPPTRLRLSVVGRTDYGEYTTDPAAQRVVVPGVEDTLRVRAVMSSDPNQHACFVVSRNDWRAAARDRSYGASLPFRATACVPIGDIWAPVEVTASNGQRLRLQLVKVPDLNY